MAEEIVEIVEEIVEEEIEEIVVSQDGQSIQPTLKRKKSGGRIIGGGHSSVWKWFEKVFLLQIKKSDNILKNHFDT